VHEWDNFAWEHDFFNIHEGMMIDKLHQMYKGIVQYLIKWIQDWMEGWEKNPENKGAAPPPRLPKDQLKDIKDTRYLEKLNYRFRQIPPFPGLKLFTQTAFSQVKQWTGVEQRAIVQQLAPVMAPILSHKDHKGAMQFVRAVLDFVTLAEYRAHDIDTLSYLDQALGRMNELKEFFRDLRPKDGKTKEGHFNFPKFHVLTHYVHYIRRYGCLDGFDSATPETGHKYQVKEPYKRTNRRVGYLEQIFGHNRRSVKLKAMYGLFFHRHTKREVNHEVPVNSVSEKKDLNAWKTTAAEENTFTPVRREKRNWRPASTVARYTGLQDFIPALAVFVRETRKLRLGQQAETCDPKSGICYTREKDPSWIQGYPVAIHASMKCWIKTGKEASDIEGLTQQSVRCADNWQGSNKTREDYVWIREFFDENEESDSLVEGMVLGKVRLIVTVQDVKHTRQDGQPEQYAGCLVDRLEVQHQGQPDEAHGMFVYKKVALQTAANPQALGAQRFYSCATVSRAAHVIPAFLKESDTFIVNNYIDWGEFNALYDLGWWKKTSTTAKSIGDAIVAYREHQRLVASRGSNAELIPQNGNNRLLAGIPTEVRGVKKNGKKGKRGKKVS
jgi:hypothetical protein